MVAFREGLINVVIKACDQILNFETIIDFIPRQFVAALNAK